jgi:hypothetical protein
MAAVVVLAVAGATTALLSGGDDSDYKSLPTCDGLASALPGKPALTVAQNVTDPEDFRGLHPAYTNIECRTADTQVFVEMYQPSNVDLIYMRQYTDHTVHDGRWRANDMFTRRTKGYEQLSANVRFSAAGPSAYSCTVTTLKRNATVDLTVPLASVTSIEEWRTACRQIAKSQMPKVVDAALG